MSEAHDPHTSKKPVEHAHGAHEETYTFGDFWLKLAYLGASLLVLGVGLSFLWSPGGRILFGETVEARVVRIVKVMPAQEDQVFRYRREFPEERDRSITFQHYVNVPVEDRMEMFRLGVDSRVQPYVNVNDRLKVSYFPDDEDKIAFATWQARSWGMGILYSVLGLVFAGTAIPMLLAVGKPIKVDPEVDDSEPEEEEEEEEAFEKRESDLAARQRDPSSGDEPPKPEEPGPDETRPRQ